MLNLMFRLLAGCMLCATSCLAFAADFSAIVEANGTVALCLSNASLLFADRCKGNGRLSIVQPVKEGAVVWRSAIGAVSIENDSSNPACGLSHAKWDPKNEEVVSTGKRITKIDREIVFERLKQHLLKDVDATKEDINGFAIDLDGDGKDEIVFAASNLDRLGKRDVYDKPVPYFVYGGVLEAGVPFPSLFYTDRGEYAGGTDAIGEVEIKGVVPIAVGTSELALLIKAGSRLIGDQTLVRYRLGTVQRIETIEFTCN